VKRLQVVGCVLLLMVASLLPTSASAGVLWCRADPVVSLNATVVDVWVEIPLQYVLLVDGPVVYTIETPSSVDTALVLNDPGYNLQGSEVVFEENDDLAVSGKEFETRFSVTVPIDESRLDPGETVPARLSILVLLGGKLVKLTTVEDTTDGVTTTQWIKGLY
jgi:hypothetical protein